jgi:hypothetical protein
MKTRTFVIIVTGTVTALVFFGFFSCSSMGAVAGIGAQVAAAAGVIDQNTANAITKTGEAWARPLRI